MHSPWLWGVSSEPTAASRAHAPTETFNQSGSRVSPIWICTLRCLITEPLMMCTYVQSFLEYFIPERRNRVGRSEVRNMSALTRRAAAGSSASRRRIEPAGDGQKNNWKTNMSHISNWGEAFWKSLNSEQKIWCFSHQTERPLTPCWSSARVRGEKTSDIGLK